MAKSSRDSVHADEFPHDASASDSHTRLHDADVQLAKRLDDQDNELKEIKGELVIANKAITEEARSTKKAMIGTWAGTVVMALGVIGGMGAFEYSRRAIVTMQADIAALRESSQKTQVDIALIQRDLRPIDALKTENTALEVRIRDLERMVDRIQRPMP